MFDLIGIAKVSTFKLPKIKTPLKWLDNTIKLREDVKKIFPWAKSAIIVGLAYDNEIDANLVYHPDYMSISKYAMVREYHKVIPKKLKKLITILSDNVKSENPVRHKIHADIFPIYEKGYAQKALGGITGLNHLWHSPLGSFVLLGGIITSIKYSKLRKLYSSLLLKLIYPDSPFKHPHCAYQHTLCASCRMCIAACPTKALKPPHLQIHRCIGYLTAEHKGKIPRALQAKMKNILFGCDICQDVCLYNKLASYRLTKRQLIERFGKVIPRVWHISILKRMSVAGFYKAFAGTPVIRMRYYKFKDRVNFYVKQRRQA